jgi:hypothetical protein
MSTSAAEDANIHSSSPFVDDDAKKAQNNNDNNDINDINDLENLKNLNDLNNFDNLSKAGHVTRFSLRTRQDVTQAKMRIRSEGSPKHPVLSELEFTFRAVHDKVDSTTLVRIGRTTFHPDPAVGHEGPLINSLGLRGIDKTTYSQCVRRSRQERRCMDYAPGDHQEQRPASRWVCYDAVLRFLQGDWVAQGRQGLGYGGSGERY